MVKKLNSSTSNKLNFYSSILNLPFSKKKLVISSFSCLGGLTYKLPTGEWSDSNSTIFNNSINFVKVKTGKKKKQKKKKKKKQKKNKKN